MKEEENQMKEEENQMKMNRRTFMQMAAAGMGTLPCFAIGNSSKKLRMALIGCGARGCWCLLPQMVNEEIVALVDPDQTRLKQALARFKKFAPSQDVSKIQLFRDYREMYEKIGSSLDAVVIATPNHHHALASLMAIRRNIHVYVEKPMALTVNEIRLMHAEAKKHGVYTQVGNHGHSTEGMRKLVEYIRAGAIGDIREVWTWDDRINAVDRAPNYTNPPAQLDWDKWIGPAEMRPFHPGLHPHDWHSWVGLGNGSIGNMGTHIIDPAFWALKLTRPLSVELSDIRPGYTGSWALRDTLAWTFPARDGMPPVKLHWFDGVIGNLPATKEYLDNIGICRKREYQNFPPVVHEIEKKYNTKLGRLGSMYMGEKGILFIGPHGDELRFIPDGMKASVPKPPKICRRVRGNHMDDFIRAIREKSPAGCDFDYSEPLAETVLLGNVAMLAGKGKYDWDAKACKCANSPKANQFLGTTYRKGWELV